MPQLELLFMLDQVFFSVLGIWFTYRLVDYAGRIHRDRVFKQNILLKADLGKYCYYQRKIHKSW